MKYKSLRDNARLIDDFVDAYRRNRGAPFIPTSELKDIVPKVFQVFFIENTGRHKTVFGICYKRQEIILKIGREEDIEKDHRVYKRLPKRLRRTYFARIFWHTKYCLLQEYGVKTEVPVNELIMLRQIGDRYGLIDISRENIRNVNGHLKIVDANIVTGRFFKLIRLLDALRIILPKRLIDVFSK